MQSIVQVQSLSPHGNLPPAFRGHAATVRNRERVVSTSDNGRHYLKQVLPGNEPGLVTLLSLDGKDAIDDVYLGMVGTISAIILSESAGPAASAATFEDPELAKLLAFCGAVEKMSEPHEE